MQEWIRLVLCVGQMYSYRGISGSKVEVEMVVGRQYYRRCFGLPRFHLGHSHAEQSNLHSLGQMNHYH